MGVPYQILGLIAAPYDLVTRQPAWREHCRSLVERFPVPAGGRPRQVLDLGCGPGGSTLTFARAAPADHVVGLDAAAAMVSRARRHDRHGSCSWLIGDASHLPLGAGSFDVAVGNSFLYLVLDRPRVLTEIARVLRPGGRLLLLEPRRQGAVADVRSLARQLVTAGPRLTFLLSGWRLWAAASGAFEGPDLERLLADAGLEGVRLTTTFSGLGWLVEARRP